jgi:hypothetical protein
VFFTIDNGQNWVRLGGNAPTISFRDLVIQTRENDLVAASFGRGFWILDDYTPLREVSKDQLQKDTLLFPVRDADWYIPALPYGDFEANGKGSQGDAFYVAPNPPFGAVFTYYLPGDLKTAREKRREAEKKREENREDTPYPGWDVLRQEENEEAPAMVLTVRNEAGDVIRRIEGPVSAGFHRVAWNLRFPRSSAWTPEPEESVYIDIPGPLAPPGTYRVSLAQRIDGKLTELGLEQTFSVKPLRERGLPGAAPTEVTEFATQLDDLSRRVSGANAAIGELLTESGAIKETLMRSGAPAALRDKARSIELELLGLQQIINGDPSRALYGDEGPVSVNARVNAAMMGVFRSTYGPTPTHREALEIAERKFGVAETALREIVEQRMPELRLELDRSGVPWTPGRGVPDRN